MITATIRPMMMISGTISSKNVLEHSWIIVIIKTLQMDQLQRLLINGIRLVMEHPPSVYISIINYSE